MKADYISLPDAVPGKTYIINSISEGKTHTKNLHAYGLKPGAKIKLLFTGPFGDPCAYEILGTVIALRASDAEHVSLYVT